MTARNFSSMQNSVDDPDWKARWEAGFAAGYSAQQVDRSFQPGDESDWLWNAVYELFQQYCLPEYTEGGVLQGLQQTLAFLRQREAERPELEAQLETYRQLALTLQNRLDEPNKARQNNTAGR